MKRLVTLTKANSEFESYLLGSFSRTERAIPVQSLNISTGAEQVTFEIVAIEEIQVPKLFSKWASILKAKNFVLLAFPMFAVVMKLNEANRFSDPITGALSTIGAFCLLLAMNLRNDFNDHMRGLDRVLSNSGSRAIQKGWIAAYQVRRLSNLLLVFGFIFGLPALFRYRPVILIVALLTVFIFLMLNSEQTGMKHRRWTELAVFLLFGPILVISYQLACGGGIDEESWVLGVVTGWFAVFRLHLKNFEQLIENSQARFDNTIASLGFEKSKKLIVGWWIAFLVLFDAYHFLYTSLFWAWMLGLSSLLVSFAFVTSMLCLQSPVGSGMTKTLFQGRAMYLFVLSLWFLENLFYLLKMEFIF